jgi:hypothetical protein
MTCYHVLPPAGCTTIRIIATLSNMSGRLLVAVTSSIWMVDGWFRGLWYDYHGDYWISLIMMLTTLLMPILCML